MPARPPALDERDKGGDLIDGPAAPAGVGEIGHRIRQRGQPEPARATLAS